MSHPVLSLRPTEPDLVDVLTRTTSQVRGLTQQISRAVRDRDISEILFVGMGGSWASSVPVTCALRDAHLGLPVYNLNAAEFSALDVGRVGPRTLLVATSHSGGTPETVAAAEQAAAQGALVVGVATDEANKLGSTSRFMLTYGSERTVTCAKYALLAELAASLTENVISAATTKATRDALDLIPQATLTAMEQAESTLAEIAGVFSGARNIYVLACGMLSGLGYLLSVCYLMEMQWKWSTHLTTADFFHGPFELAVDQQPYILFAGADQTRAHTSRVIEFLDRYDSNYRVLDAQALALPGVGTGQLAGIQHIPMAALTTRLADHFEAKTGHSLDERRYMHRVEY